MDALKPPSAEVHFYTPDVLSNALHYRLVRDSLMVVSNMNRGLKTPPLDVLAKQKRWVQGRLIEGAISDPMLTAEAKAALIEFHANTLRSHLVDLRGAKRRRGVSLVGGAPL